jgi:hypothetical protein
MKNKISKLKCFYLEIPILNCIWMKYIFLFRNSHIKLYMNGLPWLPFFLLNHHTSSIIICYILQIIITLGDIFKIVKVNSFLLHPNLIYVVASVRLGEWNFTLLRKIRVEHFISEIIHKHNVIKWEVKVQC